MKMRKTKGNKRTDAHSTDLQVEKKHTCIALSTNEDTDEEVQKRQGAVSVVHVQMSLREMSPQRFSSSSHSVCFPLISPPHQDSGYVPVIEERKKTMQMAKRLRHLSMRTTLSASQPRG